MLSIEQAKSFCKQNGIRGIEIRGKNSIRIVIKKNNRRFNFSVDNSSLTKEALLSASIKLLDLKKLAKYNFQSFIDEYNKQNAQEDKGNIQVQTTTKNEVQEVEFRHFIDSFYMSKKNTLAPSSLSNYKKKIERYITPKFGALDINLIKPMDIQNWVVTDLAHLSNKTIKDLICFLNQMFTLAIVDDTIAVNPLVKLKGSKLLKLKTCAPEREPFTLEEINNIVNTETLRTPEVNMFHFNCFAGLRIGELMALAWSDVNWDQGELSITRSIVNGIYKSPKNSSSIRKVKLLPQALAVLKQQKKQPQLNALKIDVLNSDNKSFRQENINLVFYNSKTMEPFKYDGDYRLRFFRQHLKKAGVKYRSANQTRHTYASHLVSAGLPLTWVANQMGHTGIKMLEKHYAKWMPINEDRYTALACAAFTKI